MMRWTAAEFFEPSGGGKVSCTLCPHNCRLGEGEVGACRVRRSSGGRLQTATFATAVRHLDAVERKPFYHYKPGRKALTLAAPGCSFTCHYCQNFRLSQVGRLADLPWQADDVDPRQVVEEAATHGAAIALSYSEPVLSAELTLALAAAARPAGVDILWKTNGFITPRALERVAPCLAAVNIDLKAADDARHRALTGAPVLPVIATLNALVRGGIWVEVSSPILPRINDDAESLRRLAETVARAGEHVPWHLLRFNPEFRMRGARPTPPAALRGAVEIARQAGLRYVYVERALGAEGRNTLCPGCGQEVISRGIWSTLDCRLVDGACQRCGSAVPGRW